MRPVETIDAIVIKAIEEPFRVYDPWPIAAGSLSMVDIGECIAHLPHGDPRAGLKDGMVVFMQEAYKALRVGGELFICAPNPTHNLSVSHPYICRMFNMESFFAFGRPEPEMIGHRGDLVEKWQWNAFGIDFGTRFQITVADIGPAAIEVVLEKIKKETSENGRS